MLTWFFSALAILGVAYLMPAVHVRNFWAALVAALVIAILNALVGWLLRGVFDLLTLYLLSGLVRFFVTVLMIKLAARLLKGFEVDGWLPAIVVAIAVALAAAFADYLSW